MREVKKILLLLAVVVATMVLFAVSASAEKDGHYTYEVSNGEATIIDVDESISGDITIPSTLGGYSVTTIANNAFYKCTNLTSVIIPDSVIEMGSAAFLRCTSLKEIVIPNGITTIDSGLFRNCTSLSSITIPDSVTTIADNAFYYCTNLTSISLPSGITSIGAFAFNNCSSLTNITIPDGVTSIGSDAFAYCTSLKSFSIPEGVTKISYRTFYNCTNLTSIKIPDNIIEIGSSAFENCTKLTDITLPDNIASIGELAFYNTVYYNDESNWVNDVLYIGDYLICAKSTITSCNIRQGVKIVADYAFCRCVNLTNIIIPNSVVSIGDTAFYMCMSLEEVTIPDVVTSIGDMTFYGCTSLTNITIPDSVTSIGPNAFGVCTSLKSITISDSVTSIGTDAFINTGYYNDESNWENDVLYIGDYLICAKSTITSCNIKQGVKIIADDSFRSCINLTDVIIPDSVTNIGLCAFIDCFSLERVVINGVINIMDAAFNNCYNLETVIISNSVTNIMRDAFGYCDNIKDVYYAGSREEWNKIYIGINNSNLTNSKIHYNFCFHKNQTEQPRIDSTCAEVGYTEGVYCYDCESWISGHEEIATIPHSYESTITSEPTHLKEGVKTFACSSCGDRYTESIAKLTEHTYEKTVTAPTCTEGGYTTYTCECGDSYVDDELKKLGHTNKTTTTKATLTKNGKTETKCTVCGEVTKTTTIYYPKSIKLSVTSYTYNGKVKTPSVTAKDSKGNTLKKDTDYTVKYESGRKTPGKYTVQITFKGKYSGTKKLYFTIAPRTTTKIVAAQTTSAIKLSWSKVTGATGYRVYKYNSKTKKFETLKTVTGTTLTIKKLSAGTKHYFKVRAYTKDGDVIWGDYSAKFATATKPAKPSLKVSLTDVNKATVKWTNVSGENGYQIYYSTKKDSGFKLLSNVKADTSKAVVSKLVSGKTYYFKVRAYIKTESKVVYSSWSDTKGVKVTVSKSEASLNNVRTQAKKQGAYMAAAYLGSNKGDYTDMQNMFKSLGLTEKYPFIKDIPESRFFYSNEASVSNEIFVLVPVDYKEIKIYECDPGLGIRGDYITTIKDGKPFVVRGGSDFCSNYIIETVTTSGELKIYEADLSARDGKVTGGDSIYDFTLYELV